MEVMLGGSWASLVASLHDWRLELIFVISPCILQANHDRHSGDPNVYQGDFAPRYIQLYRGCVSSYLGFPSVHNFVVKVAHREQKKELKTVDFSIATAQHFLGLTQSRGI